MKIWAAVVDCGQQVGVGLPVLASSSVQRTPAIWRGPRTSGPRTLTVVPASRAGAAVMSVHGREAVPRAQATTLRATTAHVRWTRHEAGQGLPGSRFGRSIAAGLRFAGGGNRSKARIHPPPTITTIAKAAPAEIVCPWRHGMRSTLHVAPRVGSEFKAQNPAGVTSDKTISANRRSRRMPPECPSSRLAGGALTVPAVRSTLVACRRRSGRGLPWLRRRSPAMARFDPRSPRQRPTTSPPRRR